MMGTWHMVMDALPIAKLKLTGLALDPLVCVSLVVQWE